MSMRDTFRVGRGAGRIEEEERIGGDRRFDPIRFSLDFEQAAEGTILAVVLVAALTMRRPAAVRFDEQISVIETNSSPKA